ncbi:MAG: NUDIX domain-containing protein [Burkholderiales bacterium]
MDLPVFLASDARLRAADAVAALLLLPDGRYVMQLRDALPHIFYPDHWGCFGGALEEGETPLQAIQRELDEELELQTDYSAAREFTRFDFDLTALGQSKVFRIFYEVPITPEALGRTVLREGAAVRAFSGAEILQQPRVTPYDAFALWLHVSRSRLAQPQQ